MINKICPSVGAFERLERLERFERLERLGLILAKNILHFYSYVICCVNVWKKVRARER
jgi:hypothetical protein